MVLIQLNDGLNYESSSYNLYSFCKSKTLWAVIVAQLAE